VLMTPASRLSRKRPVLPGTGAAVTLASLYPAAWDPATISTLVNVVGLALNNTRATSFLQAHAALRGNLGHGSGKWYIEYTHNVIDTFTNASVGIGTANIGTATYIGNTQGGLAPGIGYFSGFNRLYRGNTQTSFTVPSPVAGDQIMVAWDADTGRAWFGINGAWSNNGAGVGNPATGANPCFGPGSPHTAMTGGFHDDPVGFTDAVNHVYYPACNTFGVGSCWTINQVNSFTRPVGFSDWGGTGANIFTGRELVSGFRRYYVRTGGSNSNNGLIDIDAQAFATLQGLYDSVLSKLDFGGTNQVVVQMQNAAWTTAGQLSVGASWGGGGSLIIDFQGGSQSLSSNPSAAGNFWVAPGVTLAGPLEVRNATLSSTGTANSLMRIDGIGTLTVGSGMIFGAAVGAHIVAAGIGAQLQCNVAYTVNGGGTSHASPIQGGLIKNAASVTHTVTASAITFSSAFIDAQSSGIFTTQSTYSGGGAVVGKRFNGDTLGNIITNNGSPTFFPGNAGGTLANNAVYT
jgi:hypothetical protein